MHLSSPSNLVAKLRHFSLKMKHPSLEEPVSSVPQNPQHTRSDDGISAPYRRTHSTRLRTARFSTAFFVATFALLLAPHSSDAYKKKCSLPKEWRGKWFLMGAPGPVVIEESSISFKGPCLESDVDTYLIRETVNDQNCYRCLVIHQKHENVLQYKESECGWSNKLDHVCNLLTGDSKLNSMFRLDAVPVPCPFPHSYTFEYNNGGGLCSSPPSTVHSCTETWRLLFQYQACPDVRGSESMVEELTCLGVWKEGSNHYLVGISDHRRANSDADKYRCYAYAGSGNGFKMAKSGDASCHGLFSLTGGASTLRLTKVETRSTRCRFPVRHLEWHSLDGKGRLHVTRHNTTLRYSAHGETGPITYTCFHFVKSLPETSSYHRHGDSSYYRSSSHGPGHRDEFEVSAAAVSSPKHSEEELGYYVTRVFHGCTSGFKCIKLIERDHQVLEILMGKVAPVAEEACSHHFFDRSSSNYSTFISHNPESRSCPSMGRYEVVSDLGTARIAASSSSGAGGGHASMSQMVTNSVSLSGASRDGCDAPYTALTVGCSASDTLEMHTSCSNAVYSCHGWWQEPGGRQFLVVTPASRASTGARRLCLVIESHGLDDSSSGAMTVSSSTGYCSRYITPDHHMHIALNITSSGTCETLAASAASGACRTGLVHHDSRSGITTLLVVFSALASTILTTACYLTKRHRLHL